MAELKHNLTPEDLDLLMRGLESIIAAHSARNTLQDMHALGAIGNDLAAQEKYIAQRNNLYEADSVNQRRLAYEIIILKAKLAEIALAVMGVDAGIDKFIDEALNGEQQG